jgi:uncharacterized protein
VNARTIVYTPAGVIRAPWRIVLFVLAVIVSGVASQWVVYPIAQTIFTALGHRIDNPFWMVALAFIVANAICVKWIDKRPWSMVGLHREAARPPLWLLGILVGGLGIAIPTLALMGVRWMSVVPQPDGSVTGEAVRQLIFLAPAALWEELCFRGYAFAVLRESAGTFAAVGSTSLIFGLIHLSNPGASVQSTMLVALAGIFLGYVLILTGSLYAAWAAHLAWNWTMSAAFHVPVSGASFSTPDYQVIDAGPDWATGGKWGPEAGFGAALGMAGGFLLLHYAARLGWMRPARLTTLHDTNQPTIERPAPPGDVT